MKIKDIATLVTSSVDPRNNPNDYWNLYSLPSYDNNRSHEVLLGSDIQSNKFVVPSKCILFNKLNVRFRRIWRVSSHENNNICSTEFLPLVIDESKADYDYFYYLLRSDFITTYLTGQHNNTSNSHNRIDIDDFMNIEVTLPSLEEQKRLAKVVTDLDSQIDNLTAINRNLEQVARQLYDYWFVQFDFPNHEGKPYKSSGGEMVWNESLNRFIPKIFERGTLNDYIGRITNGLNPRKNFTLGSGDNYYVTIRSLLGTDIDWDNCDRCDDDALRKINSRSQLQVGDVIFSAIGTIGRTYYIQEEPKNWNISETSFTLRPKENVPNDFFYSLLNCSEIQLQADKNAMGSTLRCLVMESLCKIPYFVVPQIIMELFSAKVKPVYKSIYQNGVSIRHLQQLRDELLPMLLNGQVNCDLSH